MGCSRGHIKFGMVWKHPVNAYDVLSKASSGPSIERDAAVDANKLGHED